MAKPKVTDHVEVCSPIQSMYGNTYQNEEVFGLFDFARVSIHPEFVMVTRKSLDSLILKVVGLEKEKEQWIKERNRQQKKSPSSRKSSSTSEEI